MRGFLEKGANVVQRCRAADGTSGTVSDQSALARGPDIPRTRSGKLTELAVRDAVHGRPTANLEALANPEALAHFQNREELET